MSTQSQDANTYSIRDASRLTGLPSSTLRYYESIGIVKHVERSETSKHRVYGQKDIDVLDTVACLNATGMKLEDMKRYIANASQNDVDAYEQVALLKAQKARLDEEERHILLRREYVSLKIDYWKAYEAGDKKRVQEIAAKARSLANNLKKV
jgi:DNA-binding transcriptional MerR regulator